MSDKIIYLDNAATVMPFDDVFYSVAKKSAEYYYNPEAGYKYAVKTASKVEEARAIVAECIGANSKEIVFLSGATEANNWVLKHGAKNKKGKIIISNGEHSSIHNVVKQMQDSSNVVHVDLSKNGEIDFDDLCNKIDEQTTLVSIIHVCSQTGTINDIKKISKLVRSKAPSALIHSDGAQAFCRFDIDVKRLDVDFYTASIHKIGGLKGLGFLYIKKGVNISPFSIGGAQEFGLRAGTQNTPAILSTPVAIKQYRSIDNSAYIEMNMAVRNELKKCSGVMFFGGGIPHILSIGIENIKAEVLQTVLAEFGVLVGTGSACNTKHRDNRVLKQLGGTPEFLDGAIRISFGPHNKIVEVKEAAKIIVKKINEFRM